MVKKQSKENKPKPNAGAIKNALPQNIVFVGERVEENKNIYISQKVYMQINSFTKDKTTNESGGVLIGSVIVEFGKANIIIDGFIEAKYCEATPNTITFTHQTWDYIHKKVVKEYPSTRIIGWIHTHPSFGIFLSEYDKFIHKNFFNEENQIAYVVDPIQKTEGFYFWINRNIERCKGFYVFDKTGVEISINDTPIVKKEKKKDENTSSIRTIIRIVLVLAMIVYLLIQSSRISKLEERQQVLMDSANGSLFKRQEKIKELENEIFKLTQASTTDGVSEDNQELIFSSSMDTDKTEDEGSHDATETVSATSEFHAKIEGEVNNE